MPVFTSHLRKESELIRLGLGLLTAYCNQLDEGKSVSPEDLRMAIYAMQVAYESSLLAKEENLLYPRLLSPEHSSDLPANYREIIRANTHQHERGREYLLNLRLCVDTYERNPEQKGILSWRLADFVGHIAVHIENEEPETLRVAEKVLTSAEQKALLREAINLDQSRGHDHLQGPRLIFSRLRRSIGLTAA